MNCITCRQPFPSGTRPNRLYCSTRCAYRARANREGRREVVPAAERVSDEATYANIHRWLVAAFGGARTRRCANCERRASEWAYDHADADEKVDASSGLTYSTNLGRYVPLCRRCHRDMDNGIAGRQAACGTEAGYGRHRRVTQDQPCQPCKDAHAAAARRRIAQRFTEITHFQENPA